MTRMLFIKVIEISNPMNPMISDAALFQQFLRYLEEKGLDIHEVLDDIVGPPTPSTTTTSPPTTAQSNEPRRKKRSSATSTRVPPPTHPHIVDFLKEKYPNRISILDFIKVDDK